ncbi:MAG: NAD-dependent epimerase/dehydratase family protein [Paludibacteraceae bacterium]|nr:NAD-dependent epimerase/dehydratase family protein [Paludibacteraceae bacterium]MBO7368347.1 NAD-dependent epimerase/dehydratase family protein [Paludibacteraceae bacterium]MBR4482827.1 NAD-dependent epimerase/dehydratase family protein [Paludibacteraceae bacterium]
MLRIGITGQAGFVGTTLYNHLGIRNSDFERIPFEDSYFNTPAKLSEFVRSCDVIVHLAAMNRDPDPQVIYDTNIRLVKELISAMERENVRPHVLFSSSTQETLDNMYGKSKAEGRAMFEKWAEKVGASFTGLVIPNVYGEFSRPNYNTFIATFSHKLINGEEPQILVDNNVRLIHVGSLCRFIISQFSNSGVKRVEVPYDFEMKVTDILAKLRDFNNLYTLHGIIPNLKDCNDINLFNTFRSYIEPAAVQLEQHADERGVFVETIKLGVGGQVSFSTTKPGITRGNHYHTRKIERFTVIKGKASIELRRIGTDKVYHFELDGKNPAYVDMPVWYTHNITNIGTEELYTQFWINEIYNPADGDTYFEKV